MADAKFSWASAADVGLGIAGAFASWGNASAKATVAQANADASNVIRKAQNVQRASALSLAATVRSLATRNTLTNAGEASNGAAELLARTQQSWTTGRFDQGLRDVENLGAFQARAAAAGIGGASVQAVSYSVRLQQARVQKQMDERQGQLTYEMLKQRAGIMPAAESHLDISPLSPNFDYSTNTATDRAPNLLAGLVEGLLSKGKSLQTALDSIPKSPSTPTDVYARGDFTRMDRANYTEYDGAVSSPVTVRNPVGTPLAPFTID